VQKLLPEWTADSYRHLFRLAAHNFNFYWHAPDLSTNNAMPKNASLGFLFLLFKFLSHIGGSRIPPSLSTSSI